jgi:hypothetical protein
MKLAVSKTVVSSSAASWTPAVTIAVCALAFTVASFWWLNVRRGHLKSFEPHSFGAYVHDRVRIRFPLVFHNTGAVPIVIQNLRIKFLDKPDAPPLPWVATRSHIKPESDDDHAFPAVFSVGGRTACQTFQEFGAPSLGFCLDAKDYRMRLEAKLGHKKEWSSILSFTFHAWRIGDPEHFITYENTPGIISNEDSETVQMGLEFAQTGWQARFAQMSPGKTDGNPANLPTANEPKSGS